MKFEIISAVWYSQTQIALENCASQIYDFLVSLNEFDNEYFDVWFEKSSSLNKSKQNRVELSQMKILSLLKNKVESKSPDLGSRISLWTGKDFDRSAEVSFKLGAYGTKPYNNNLCVLQLPQEFMTTRDTESFKRMLILFDEFWKPTKILIDGEEFRYDKMSRKSGFWFH
jgi:hypothetical protein